MSERKSFTEMTPEERELCRRDKAHRTRVYKRVTGHLTPKEEKFCQLIAQGRFSNTECARQAGYAEKSAAHQAHRIQQRAHVQKRIEELRTAAGKRNDVTIDEVIGKLRQTYEEAMANGQTAAAVQAARALGQYLGMFSEKLNIKAQGSLFTGEAGHDFERLSTIASMNKKSS